MHPTIKFKCMENEHRILLMNNEHIDILHILKYGIDPEKKVRNFLENTDKIDMDSL